MNCGKTPRQSVTHAHSNFGDPNENKYADMETTMSAFQQFDFVRYYDYKRFLAFTSALV